MRTGITWRFGILGVTLFLSFILLWGHVYKLQISRHTEFDKKSLPVYQRTSSVQGQRGRIFDVAGHLLACDLAGYDIFIEPRRFKDILPEVLEMAESCLEIKRSEVIPRLTNAMRYRYPCEAIERIDGSTAQQILAENLPQVEVVPIENSVPAAFRVLFYPHHVPEEKYKEIATALGKYAPGCEKSLPDKIATALIRQREVLLKRNISFDAAQRFMEYVRNNKISGVHVREISMRNYPRESRLANMLGYLDQGRKGVSGIESLCNDVMKPTPGKVQLRRDRLGRPVEDAGIVIEPAQNGADVYLTICEPIQQIVEEEMAPLIEKYKPDYAYALMMNPATGAIMAAAQFPQFNPNDRSTMQPEEVLPNHALFRVNEPGSIMKGISVAYAMEKRVVRLDSKYYCEHGSWRYGGKILRDGTHHYDDLTVAEIIQKSSNIGAAKIAMDLGEELLYKGMREFGFGTPTGIGYYPEDGKARTFPTELPGNVRKLSAWDTLTITRMPIGQGISVTPWQMLQAWGSLANGGVMMQPYIIDRIVYPDGRTVPSVPRVKGVPVSRETATLMTEAFKLVTEKGGTGTRAAVEGYTVAGKTGTAQMCINVAPKGAKPKYLYSSTMHFASFVGFVPADAPEFILLISAEYPKGPVRAGGIVCAPVFKQIAKRTLEYLQVPPTLPAEDEEKSASPMGNVAQH